MRQTVIILPWLVAVVLAGCGASPPVDEAIIARGRTLYNNSCAACHQLAGEEVDAVRPLLVVPVHVVHLQGHPGGEEVDGSEKLLIFL